MAVVLINFDTKQTADSDFLFYLTNGKDGVEGTIIGMVIEPSPHFIICSSACIFSQED